ncbi:uncharacterized protein LOC143574212 [Bidens hawaiensis]|uniref:uncharacterized protein LOC143574212 n=1 Tax=Bidens hawaiensis TaxID=980011 RepID=UPI0040493F8B
MNAKIPTSVGTYNGMTDPSDHLLRFVAVGGVSGWTLPYWCHMFALTFTGAARDWFEKLPAGQIKSWNDFVTKFSQHFSHQKKHTRDPSEILDVSRRNNESNEDFITRFNNESLNIGGVSEDMLRGAFCKNVHSDALIRTLTGRDGMPESWDEIMKAATVFARTEKTLGSIVKSNHQGLSFKLRDQTNMPKGQYGQDFSQEQKRLNHSMQDRLSTPSEILTIENLTFRKPQPLPRKSFLDNKKHCSYHNDIGHNTNECVALRNKIEAAVKNGKLEHLGKGKGKKREYLDEEWKNEPMIFSWVKGGPCNKNPLIITAQFGHYRSQYVFFDTGSTSDIMYELCFEQLDEEDKERLKPIHAPVSGFGGEVMHPRGVILFPVKLCDGVHSRTEEVEFLVLPATSKHIILGREAIGDLNAHPSTAHGAV